MFLLQYAKFQNFLMNFPGCILVFSFIHVHSGTSPSLLSGDANPPGYSVLDVDVDTIEGPVSVKPSIIGYVNSLEGVLPYNAFR